MKIFLMIALFSINAFANFPKNNLRIPVDAKFRNDMTEEKFNSIIDRVNIVFAPIVKSKKGNLFFSRNWKDETVNASANRFGGNAWFVNMYGGLARHPLVTDDAFMLVVCHELGHHLGGTPTKGGINGFWASTEGQADYFGALKCMRRILINDDNVEIIQSMDIEPVLKDDCQKVYSDNKEVALCERVGMAGLSLARLLSSLGDNSEVSFETKDSSVVKKSDPNHPKAQCRLDTYFEASLCSISYNEDVDKKDPTMGVCTLKKGFQRGMRPLCWYHPSKKE